MESRGDALGRAPRGRIGDNISFRAHGRRLSTSSISSDCSGPGLKSEKPKFIMATPVIRWLLAADDFALTDWSEIRDMITVLGNK